ncbi:MAG: LysR family transcriptional regulator [Xanthobacteraceae bacterium]|nr:LysR family transcriptional regulator [Xanthobacteraceae bacterium]
MDRFDQITTFVRVVELGGLSAAARDLGVAPSVVTSQLQALEQRLGARLLNRNTRHVKPTDVGQAYYQHCVDVLRRFEQADSLVECMQATPRGVLRVNVSIPIGDLITPVIADYTAQFADVSVKMISTGREVDFIEEQFDVSIRHAMPDNPNLIVRKLAEYDYVVCASPKYFENRPQPRTPDDLAGLNCIVYSDSKLGDRWSIFQTHEAITPRGNLQTNSPMVLIKAAENGQGIVVLPCFTAAQALAEGRLVQLLKNYPTVVYPIVAIHPHRGLVPTRAAVFIDMVAKYLRNVLPDRNELQKLREQPAPSARPRRQIRA